MKRQTPAAAALALQGGGAADYFALLKPRVMSLVIFTGLVGLMLAPGHIHPVLGLAALLCVAVGAGASGALNMWYDADIDARMSRTRARPVPAGRIEAGAALGFGATLATGSVVVMGLTVNLVAAALLALTIGFYLFVYTMWLKRRTAQNIVIGGAAGALPPVIGWVAVTGGLTPEPLALFAIIFLWTPPHFWALSLYSRGDFEAAGLPMLPIVSGEAATIRQIMIYSLLLVPASFAPLAMGFAGTLYGAVAAVAAAGWLACATRLWRRRDDASARRLFGFSILYLFALFSGLLMDTALGGL